ncbi:MAG: cobalt-precorrin-5B (C(1))-methyltransferase [Pseudomonadota bacterium]
MRDETPEQKQPLRTGLTTGACATATSLAAAKLLLTGEPSETIEIALPRGKRVAFDLTACALNGDVARADTVKDAGDDPDATHGATVFAQVQLREDPGVVFTAAEGVGTVTRTGLTLAVGEPAINPVPREMMSAHLTQLADALSYSGGFDVAIGIVNGEKIAEQTMNGRLGILGGLSILGTTGIVRPYSCAAFIASIHQGIDVAIANGVEHIAACTGSTSERVAYETYGLEDMGLLEMGDFAGAVLKYIRKKSIARVSFVGGFGKLSKLADGHLDLHSRRSSVNFDGLSLLASQFDSALGEKIQSCNTTAEALQYSQQAGVALGDRVCERAMTTIRKYANQNTRVDVIAIDRSGEIVGRAS